MRRFCDIRSRIRSLPTTWRIPYFGKVVPVSRRIESRYDLFDWLMEAYRELPRATLLERVSKAPHFEALKSMSDSDLRAEYCEAMVASFEDSGFKTSPTKKALAARETSATGPCQRITPHDQSSRGWPSRQFPFLKGVGSIPNARTNLDTTRATSAIWRSAERSHHMPDGGILG